MAGKMRVVELLILSPVLLVLAGTAAAQIAPPFIVFGDSTVDTGNNNYINTTLDFRANVPPYGQQHFGKPNGRFSNGRIFMDFLCEMAGVPYVPPYLEPDADRTGGVNFGSGGAGALPQVNEGLVIPLDTQLEYFTEFHEAIFEKRGSQQARKYFSDAIFLLSIANNDYLGGYLGNETLREQHSPQDFIVLVISKIIQACEFLHSMGARKLVVFTVGSLGCIPAVRQFSPTQGCFQPGVDLGMAHNMALGGALKDWQSMHPDVILVEAGLYEFMWDRINNPTEFGYSEGVAACCGSGQLRGTGPCSRANPITQEEYSVCDNPEEHVFWDPYHGSEMLHKEFAKDFWDGSSKPVSSPLTMRQLFELSASPSSEDEQLGAFTTAPAAPLEDAHIGLSSF